MQPNTAILLFSRSHHHGEARRYGHRAVSKELAKRALCTTRRSGLPVFRFTEREQRGATFGERLAGATHQLFARGFERLIIVGHDCPSLTVAQLRTTARLLERGRNVVGPDRRGGSWLIGLRRTDFDAQALAALPWQTAGLYAALLRFLPDCIPLQAQSDLNSVADIRAHMVRLRGLLGNISRLVDVSTPAEFLRGGVVSDPFPPGLSRRGPPVCC